MSFQIKTGQASKALLAICMASLSLTACGSRLHNNHAQTSGACGAYVQSCPATRYGHAGYNNASYETAYQAPYVQTYPAHQPAYIPTQQSVVSYVQTPAPAPIPTPVYEPEPFVSFAPAPITEPEPQLSTWTPEPSSNSWAPPWRDEPDCPEGTIEGYGGSDCVQVAIPRK